MTAKMMIALVLSLVITTVIGKYYIPWLRRQKAGQEIKENGPTWHMSKAGTPTMGGVMFIAAALIVCLTVGFSCMLQGDYKHIFVFCVAFAFGLIGFLDDWEKIKHKQNLGLSAKAKFGLQLLVALAAVVILKVTGLVSNTVYVPFFNTSFTMPWWLYMLFAMFVIVGTVNAVNITDGVDGLSSGTSIPVFLFFAAVAFYWGEQYLSLGIFASAMVGGLIGFLFYNFNPAKCFMGDTGSLFMGGAVSALAFAYDMPLILITVGIIYLAETMSDIIQVGYFKLSHGKRVFRMAPLHHHLEMGGFTGKKWKEKELFCLFSGISLLFAIISFIGIYHRF